MAEVRNMLRVALCLSLLVSACAPADPPRPSGRATDPAAVTPGEPPMVEASDAGPRPTTIHTLYVPVYSHVYWGPEKHHFNLACTLSVRNVDTRSSISLTTVDYHDTAGALVRRFIEEPRVLAPLETVDFYIPERDTSGGSGANFIVGWGSSAAVDAPLVEAVMIGVDGGQGISFVSPARETTQ